MGRIGPILGLTA